MSKFTSPWVVVASVSAILMCVGQQLEAEDPLLPCRDVNNDGASDVTDAIYFLTWHFLGGDPPACGAEGTAALPATGQSICYDPSGEVVGCTSETCVGQDGLHATECHSERRFEDNGDGTITDRCTGLMWQEETGNGGNGLDWCDALAYCEGLEFAGHDDWRLPNVKELQSIVDYGRTEPAIDPAFSALTARYWTSTSDMDVTSCAWYVSFYHGRIRHDHKSSDSYRVRAVRNVTAVGMANAAPPIGAAADGALPPCQDINGDGSSDITDAVFFLNWRFLGGAPPTCSTTVEKFVGIPDTGQTTCFDPDGAVIECERTTCVGQDSFYAGGCPSEGRFTDNRDGTVTDTCTGLMWQKDAGNDGNGLDWCSALAYCEGLELGGHDDWRLPNIRELQSLIDYGRKWGAVDPVFSVDPIGQWPGGYWASTSFEDLPQNAWHVSFYGGTIDNSRKRRDDDYFVRAVRSLP